MSLEEAILDKVRCLPPAKQEEVLRFADGLQRNATTRLLPSRDRTKEVKWIDENRAAYADQWVAVESDRLVAAGNDPLKVFAAAKEEGIPNSVRRARVARRSASVCSGLVSMQVSLTFDAAHHYGCAL